MTETSNIGQLLDEAIYNRVGAILDRQKKLKRKSPKASTTVTGNIGELIELLIIYHIRVWHFEDTFPSLYKKPKELSALKRKMDIIWKDRKPAVLAAINAKFQDAVIHSKSLREESVKKYRGFE